MMGGGSDCIDGNASNANASSSFSVYSLLNTDRGDFKSLWDRMYKMISYCNLAIYGAGQSSLSDAEKEDALAEAYFFRGWGYLRMAEMFGGVPLVVEYTDQLRYDYQRATREETYAQAIEDLEHSARLLPDKAASGRVSSATANHFLAEAYLAQGVETGNSSYYAQAISAADKVIAEHPLMTERFGVRANPDDTRTWSIEGTEVPYYKPDGNVFYDLFLTGNYDASENTEAVWVLKSPTYEQVSSTGGVFTNSVLIGQPYRDVMWSDAAKAQYPQSTSGGPWYGDIDDAVFKYGNTSAYLGGGPWGFIGSNDYIDEIIWEGDYADDLRNSQIVLCKPVVMVKDHPLYMQVPDKNLLLEPARYMSLSCKMNYQDMWGFDSHHNSMGANFSKFYGRDTYAVRSADTYLLKAEAQLRAGNKSEAVATLNVVRARAKAGKLVTADEIDIYTIVDERARELMWEEHRWATLLRMASSKEENVVMHYQVSHYSQSAHDTGVYNTAPTWSLFPIPLSVIQINKDTEMEQNPGWK
jgi:hypothetical protein